MKITSRFGLLVDNTPPSNFVYCNEESASSVGTGPSSHHTLIPSGLLRSSYFYVPASCLGLLLPGETEMNLKLLPMSLPFSQ
jgi:hypothetical protein